MKYYEYNIHITPYTETASDIMAALLSELGFETFMTEESTSNNEEEKVMKAYIQQELCNKDIIDACIKDFPLNGFSITYSIEEPEDRDWNEEWEKEGFEPISIRNELLICDTHHEELFEGMTYDYRLMIHPRRAFGTGTHQTTRMILEQLLQMDLQNKRVIDAGCGTGILGFLCLKKGASYVMAYDIDDWSSRNTSENAKLNFGEEHDNSTIENRLEIYTSDASCLDTVSGYDLLIANINRNILLNDMKIFTNSLKDTDSQLLLSGFYRQDVDLLIESASTYGFKLVKETHDGDWTMLLLGR